MSKLTLIARLLLGFIFAASGVAFFFTTPPPLEGPMAEFFKGMMATGYFFTFLKVTEIVCGLLLLSGFFVPLALVGLLEAYLAFFAKPYSQTIKMLFRAK